MKGLNDLDVLALAAAEKRVLVTHDAKTMPWHFGEFIRSHEGPGVIVISQQLPLPTVVQGAAPDRIRDDARGLDEPYLPSAAIGESVPFLDDVADVTPDLG